MKKIIFIFSACNVIFVHRFEIWTSFVFILCNLLLNYVDIIKKSGFRSQIHKTNSGNRKFWKKKKKQVKSFKMHI